MREEEREEREEKEEEEEEEEGGEGGRGVYSRRRRGKRRGRGKRRRKGLRGRNKRQALYKVGVHCALSATHLLPKLVARKGHDAQPPPSILPIQLYQLSVVLLRQSSLRRHVHYQRHMTTTENHVTVTWHLS